MKSFSQLVVGALLLLSAQAACALSFNPSPSEWANWTPYCRARYVVSGAGEFSEYRNKVNPAEVEKWKGRTGGDAWYGLHHYCAGLVFFRRAQVATTKKNRAELLQRSISESDYALRRTKPENPMYGAMLIHIARSNYELGNVDTALTQVRNARQLHPQLPEPYAAESIFFYRAKKYTDAKAILEAGIKNVTTPSAELHYFMGLTSLKLNDYELAREHAEQAYQLGYRLPGLKRKLASAGYKLNVQ